MPAATAVVPAPPATALVYIVRRAWHIDIAFAAADLQQPLRSLSATVPQAQYLEFGFGDRHYLLTRNHGTSTLFAAVWPGASLILMTALKATPQEAFGAKHVVVLRVSEAQAVSIQNFVWGSMSATPAGEALRAGALRIRSSGVLFAAQLQTEQHAERSQSDLHDEPSCFGQMEALASSTSFGLASHPQPAP